ncbi:MAG TPA: PadR family transcriptional regulator [Vitreimonas sp.]|jgi:DNA-binding PadR family transcriptional regulator|nr:PadR family transcriptional regulator [Vitreimonas sp.]
MSVPHAVLGLLQQGPRHGYDLKRLVDRYFAPDHPVAFAQIYSTLARLEGRGRVRLDGVEQAEGPERRRYAITDEGVSELDRWIGSPLHPEPHLQAALFTKVVLAILTRRPVAPIVDAERHAHLERMRELTALRRTASLPVGLLADYALFHLEADLRWLDLTAARVEDLRRDVLEPRETSR